MRRTRQQAKNERAASTDASTPSLGLSDDLSKDQATISSTSNAIATESAETSAAGQKRASQDGTLNRVNVPKKRSKWDPSRVLTDPNSPLTKVNLRRVLTSPEAWNALTAEQKAKVASFLPDEQHLLPKIDGEPPQLNFQSLMNDDGFHHDCQTYINNLAGGQHELKWLTKAFQASRRRKDGEFDAYLKDVFEKDFGVEYPTGHTDSSELPATTADAGPQTELESKTTETDAQH